MNRHLKTVYVFRRYTCRDIDPKYIPQNDDEKRCIEYLKAFNGDICNCMNNFHGICQTSESMTPV